MIAADTITDADIDMLDNVRLLNGKDMALMPESIGDLSRCRKLARSGLLDEVWCKHEDTGREGQGFNLTPDGEQIINARKDGAS